MSRSVPDAAQRFMELNQLAAKRATTLRVPGYSLGVLFNGETHTAAFGVANTDIPVPVTERTLFQIGSTTKTATATLVMDYVERGLCDLDAPLRSVIPGFRLRTAEATEVATLRHCLTHTGGWQGDLFVDTGDGPDALSRLVGLMADVPQIAAPGGPFSYNNAGFYLAGRVVELLSGQEFECAVAHRLFTPLGMANSFFHAKDVLTRTFAVGHRADDEDGLVVARPWALPRNCHAAGGIVSDVLDQLQYCRFHLGLLPPAETLPGASTLRHMQEPQVEAGPGEHVGLSWLLRTTGEGKRLVTHGGATHGQASALVISPVDGFAITMLTNAETGAVLHREVVDYALDAFLGVERVQPELLTRVEAGVLGEFSGTFATPAVTAVISAVGDHLEMLLTHHTTFTDVEDEQHRLTMRLARGSVGVIQDGPMAGSVCQFVSNPAGETAWIRLRERLIPRVA